MRSLVVIAAFLLVGCDGSADRASGPAAEPLAPSAGSTTPTGSATGDRPSRSGPVVLDELGGGGGEQICALVPASDVEGWLGGTLNPAEVAGPLDSACEWDVADGEATLMIQAMNGSFFVEPGELDPDVEPLTGIGDEGFSGPGLFGDWVAQALKGDLMLLVSVENTADDKALAVEILRETLPELLP